MPGVRAAAGPLVLLAGLVGGVGLGERLGPATAGGALVAALGLVCVSVLLGGRATRLAVGVLACGLVGTASVQRSLHGLVRSPLTAAVERHADVAVLGTLVDDPDAGRFTTRVLVRLAAVDDGRGRRSAGGRIVLVRAPAPVASRLGLAEAGDRVELLGSLEPLGGGERRFRWRHAVGALAARDLVAFSPASTALWRVANRLRAVVSAGSESLPPDERALLRGFLLGDTRGLPESIVRSFRAAGLTHLLVVSGENVAFVLALVGPVLRRLRLRARFVAGLGVLVVFGTMVRWEPSVLRAVAMTGCVMLASLLGRPASGVRVLALAVLALLAVDPFLLHSVGFLLSCGATAGIASLAAPIARRLPGPRSLGEPLAVTAAAQLGVAPVLVPVFGSMPLVALPANLLAAPLVGPLTVWGLASGVAGGLARGPLPALARAAQLPSLALLRTIEDIAALAARAPFALDGRSAGLGLALAGGVAAAGALRARREASGRLETDAMVPPR